MRWMLAALANLVVGVIVSATSPDTNAPPAGPPLEKGEAQNYAQQLLVTLNEVAKSYVRPVTREELAVAALAGLYEAARIPTPANLEAQVAKAATDQDLLAVLARVRTSLGNIDQLRGHQALLVSYQAMARSLDPYSGVISGEELNRGSGEESQVGFGFQFADLGAKTSRPIKTVFPGGPAQRAGLRPGDRITAIDGADASEETIQALKMRERKSLETGGGDLQVAFTVERPGDKEPRKVSLTAALFRAETVLGVQRKPDNSWNYFLDGQQKIAHVRIASLAAGTSEDLQQVLTRLKADGLRGLILDLRWCPGGYLNEAVVVARMFLKAGCTVATVRYRSKPTVDPYVADADSPFTDFPMVVLINGETSGGAELIAAALEDNNRALVAGQRTLGKASVQSLLALPVPNAGLKLTSGMFQRPSGKDLHRQPDSKLADDWGVRPAAAHDFRIPPDVNKQLRDWWLLQTLRPGPSNDALPLDDLDNDPQRQAALRGLLERINRLKDEG